MAEDLPEGQGKMADMTYCMLADLVVVLHLGFVIFALLGGLLVLVHKAWAWVHLPCVAWATMVELTGWICPLTPIENWLRQRGGAQGYDIGFVEHYLVPILYPASLTRGHQVALGFIVLGINAGVYILAMRRARAAPAGKRSHRRH